MHNPQAQLNRRRRVVVIIVVPLTIVDCAEEDLLLAVLTLSMLVVDFLLFVALQLGRVVLLLSLLQSVDKSPG